MVPSEALRKLREELQALKKIRFEVSVQELRDAVSDLANYVSKMVEINTKLEKRIVELMAKITELVGKIDELLSSAQVSEEPTDVMRNIAKRLEKLEEGLKEVYKKELIKSALEKAWGEKR